MNVSWFVLFQQLMILEFVKIDELFLKKAVIVLKIHP